MFANLIIYWGGFEVMWKLDCAIILGLIVFGIGVGVKSTTTSWPCAASSGSCRGWPASP